MVKHVMACGEVKSLSQRSKNAEVDFTNIPAD
uniref:Uncharacterized protein n=1 Tax=Rhizophora mucronata TaxID=61149 RepID=A0A2P2N9C2_RHIMU